MTAGMIARVITATAEAARRKEAKEATKHLTYLQCE
jgi:hypothetical protein